MKGEKLSRMNSILDNRGYAIYTEIHENQFIPIYLVLY